MTNNHLREVELALEKSVRLMPYRCLLLAFWGLILAKCLILEWAVQTWASPVDTVVYVWLPTLVFGGLCTVLFARSIFTDPLRAPLTSHLVRGVWGGCLIAALVVCLAWLRLDVGSPYLLPALAAVIIGLGYFIQSILDDFKINKFLAICWWLTSLVLFYFSDVTALAMLGIAFIVLTALPYTVLFFRYRVPVD